MIMQTQEFSIQIHSTKERVWEVLWNDVTFRNWSGLIDEGTYMKGELKEGEEVEFISAVSGYGVTSFVEKLVPCEYVLFRQMVDTKESGEDVREEEWTGGTESYALTEHDGVTTLTVTTEVPPSQEDTMRERIPKALERIQELAEANI